MRNSLLILSLLLTTTLLHAKERGTHVTREKVGQEYYLKACATCHGDGKIAGNMATQREWKALLDANASELIYLHEDVYSDKAEKNAVPAIQYLQSEQFVKEKRKLLKFLQEFASDSPDIPTCY
jgi:mono/diheme cytochrome c family protein